MEMPRVAFDEVSWRTVTSQAETLNKARLELDFGNFEDYEVVKEEEEPSDSHLEFEQWCVFCEEDIQGEACSSGVSNEYD